MMGKGSIILGSDPDLEVMRIKGEEMRSKVVLGDGSGPITRGGGEGGAASVGWGPEGDSEGSVPWWVILGHTQLITAHRT